MMRAVAQLVVLAAAGMTIETVAVDECGQYTTCAECLPNDCARPRPTPVNLILPARLSARVLLSPRTPRLSARAYSCRRLDRRLARGKLLTARSLLAQTADGAHPALSSSQTASRVSAAATSGTPTARTASGTVPASTRHKPARTDTRATPRISRACTQARARARPRRLARRAVRSRPRSSRATAPPTNVRRRQRALPMTGRWKLALLRVRSSTHATP
jgi:hypothetical protein